MKRLLITTAISAAVAAGLATPAFAETKSYDLAGFTHVSAAAGTSVNVEVGGDYSVVAESSSEGLDRLRIDVVGDELQIGRRRGTMGWGRGVRVVVNVRLPALSGLDVSSGASIEANNIDASSFEIGASSGGSLEAVGRCDALDVDVSSGGSIDARGLECRTADADASSGGSADIFASERISGDASSGGSIDVYGKPANVSKDTSSGGSVSVR
ncbi:MAG: DUF2807 domain-containing protein [Parvularculaceae bacterium]|nr:DUF2807 domain-containing protein [Parvularculaceae bacterium]